MGNAVIRADIRKTIVDDQAQDIAVFNHHPFGLSGGARSIDDVGQMTRSQPPCLCLRIGVRLRTKIQRRVIQPHCRD
ncbi:hypothetical protein Xekk_02654 [Xenorhabdus sp. KK7.4]|nr:hypothetical protein Xekk_02654 [Xenorhabdus sp. KK7.4]